MKQNFAILAVTALLLCSLTACGGDQNNGAANGNVNGAENGTTSGMTGKTDSGSNVGGELKTDPATGTRYTGRENDSVVRYGNGYGNTSADKRAGHEECDGELHAPRQLQQPHRHARGADRGLGARYVERAALPSHAGKRPRP